MNQSKIISTCILALTMAACLSKCVSPSDTELGAQDEITGVLVTGADQINTGACVSYTIRPINDAGETLTAAEQTQLRVISTGDAQIYEDEACETATSNLTVASGENNVKMYLQNTTLESFELRYEGQNVKNIEVTKFSDQGAQQLNGLVRDILPLRDGSGSVYLAGDFTQMGSVQYGGLGRLLVEGSADTSFAIGEGFGRASGTLLVNDLAYANNFSNDIYVAGNFNRFQGGVTPELVKIFGNGSLDSPPSDDFVSLKINKVLVTQDDKIMVGGQFNEIRLCNASYASSAITKMSLTLNFDANFLNVPSIEALCGDEELSDNIPPYFNSSNEVHAFLQGPDNQLYVGGRFLGYNDGVQHEISSNIIRINENNGFLDTDFNPPAINGRVYSIEQDSQGRLYVGGTFFNVGAGENRDRLIRLTATGDEDTTFAIGTGFDATVFTMHVTDNETVYVGGDFTEFNGEELVGQRLVRLSFDGTIDETFDVGTGFNGPVYVVQSANDQSGDIFVGGDFTQYNGQAVNYIVRLTETGALD
jgi:hypothetical protein